MSFEVPEASPIEGYAVLDCNYRGSTGFGRSFLRASFGEWAGKMHQDLLDAVDWAVERRIAQRDKVSGRAAGPSDTRLSRPFLLELCQPS